ncbi:hypothetical protein FRX31_016802 [Thalictrum thalictroides]|uniref:Uncharacterized protein n=1 Tax=Thalictrum thalictroides TaxID=46969 RepID=A0A7J6W9L4_THATH|nr:hypothetical protein FRX31_016802 [Thalictrum thalictroides]
MSRLYYLTAKNNNKFTNKITCSSSYFVSNHRFSSFPSPQTIPSPPLASKKKFSLLKFGIFSAFLGTAATAGYATYTYTVDQVDELTKEFRQLVTMITVENDVSSIKKYKALLYSAAMTGSCRSYFRQASSKFGSTRAEIWSQNNCFGSE